MSKIRISALFCALFFVVLGCGDDGESPDLDYPDAELEASDPAIPDEVGLATFEWSSSEDSFTMVVEDGDFVPPDGTFSTGGAIFSYGESSSSSVSAGGQLKIRWENTDDPIAEGEPSEASVGVSYGLSGDFTLEPGTYDVAANQTTDGSPWFNGSNTPKLLFPDQGRRYGDRKDAVLVIEEVTDTNMTGHLITTGEYAGSKSVGGGDFESVAGTFRLAIGFNAYRMP